MENKAKLGIQFFQDSLPAIIFFAVIAIVVIVFSNLSPVFFTPGNFLIALKHLSTISLAALGLTFVVAVGKSDMSFHFISCLSGISMAFFIKLGWSPVPSIIMGLLIALVFGLIDGLAVGKFKLPDMIVTIAIGSVAFGMGYLYTGGMYIYERFLTSGIIKFADGRLYGIPYPVIYLFVAYILAYIFLHQTKYGRNFYAIGSNPSAARFSGVKVEKYIVIAYLLCIGLAAFANQILVAAQGNGNVRGGQVLLLPAWAAVFVGISIFKKPSIIGTFLGAFLIAIMQNGFTLLNSPFYIMDLIVGSTLAGALLVSRIEIKRKSREDSFPSASRAQAQ